VLKYVDREVVEVDLSMHKIGPYEIVETLQQGAKPLYRARAADGRTIALKAIPLDGITADARERFLREAESLRALNRPELVRVLEVAEADGMLYQAMELPPNADMGLLLADRSAVALTPEDGIGRAAFQAQRSASPVSMPPPSRPKAVIPSVQISPGMAVRPSSPAPQGAPAPAKPKPVGLYIAVGLSVALAIALIVVLMTK
jgi:hypothetical protein